MEVEHVQSSSQWESRVGYARAIRRGPWIAVSGTTSTDTNGSVFAPNDPYRQAKRAISTIEKALADLEAGLKDVVRTRMFVTNIDYADPVARAHHEAFAEIRPAATMVEVSRLVHPDMLVEIEADAVTTSSI